MASRIKGITVEIGGDTTGLEKALKQVNATIKTTQSELKDVERLLKLDPVNTQLLAQKQKDLKEAICHTMRRRYHGKNNKASRPQTPQTGKTHTDSSLLPRFLR